MSDNETKKDGKNEKDDLVKQVASISYIVRKMKDWLEEKMGADIDGDGRIGSGPYKKVLVFLLIAGLSFGCLAAEDKNAVAWWNDNAKINSTGFVGNAAALTNASITVTKQTGAVTASGANNLVTPTATITKQTGAVTASGVNNLVTPTAVITPQTATPTATPSLQTGVVTASGANNLVSPTITVTIQTAVGYDSTGAAITNAAGETMALMTNAIATCSPALASNAVVAVIITGGDAVVTNLTISVTPDLMTNATCAITPDLASNSVVAVTVTGGDAVMTNATSAITPNLASNSVVAVSVTGGGAVVTNVLVTNP